MQLTNQQVDFIFQKLSTDSQVSASLREDIIEHVCCLTESYMENGQAFGKAYEQALAQTCPNGLEEIYRENLFLLNTYRLKTMKKTLAIIGLIASMGFMWGFISKIMHWPGANTFMHGGALFFALIFAPLWVIDHFKTHQLELSDKVRWITGLLAGASFSIGATFKLMHWPGAGMMIVVGGALFAFVFLPIYFFKMYRKQVAY